MNGELYDQHNEVPVNRKDRRSLSFSHSRFHRRNSSSEEDDESPVRNAYFHAEYDDDYSRDSLSEFSRVTLEENGGRGYNKRDPHDDLSAITRKRTFSSSEPNSADADANTNGKGSDKRVATKICRVCGDKAYSYNFSVVTCESCKAFFRRNANKDKDIRCPFNDNCDINIVSRRFCQKCRLAKCFKVGMKKEWIMSEQARKEKKQRIQDNRERRMAEKAREDEIVHHHQMAIPPLTNGSIIDPTPTQVITNGIHMTPPSDPTIAQPQIVGSFEQNLAPLSSGILPLPVLAPAPAAISTIIPSVQSDPSPSVMQQVIQQAQQVQNAQIAAANLNHLAQVALQQSQADPMISQVAAAQVSATNSANLNNLAQIAAMQSQPDLTSIQQAAQIAQMVGTTAVPSQTTNAVAVANLNSLAQMTAMQQTSPDTIVSIQATQSQIPIIGTTAVPAQTSASIVSLNTTANLNTLAQAAAQIQQKVQLEQISQQINANLAAQRIQASQNLADQQQLAAAVAVAAISNQQPIVQPAPEPIQPSIASAILPSIIPPTANPAPLALVEPVIQPVLPPVTNPNSEMIAVRKDVLIGIVQENIENRQAQLQAQVNTPPVKCKCTCQCGRYSTDSVIVDKIMSDMLQEAKNSITPPMVNHQVESMDCSTRLDNDLCLLTEDDRLALNELEQADKIFWATEPATIDTNASDAALRKIIRMVSSLNTFNKFSRQDQSNLLRHGAPSHFVIRQAMGNLNENQPNNLMVIQFYNSLNEEWRSNRQLMLLLSIMVVFDNDCPNIENRAQIVETCSRLKSILKRMLYTIYLDAQKTNTCFDDLIQKLNVLQTLNNSPMQQSQNAVEYRQILEPLLSRELFEPNLMTSNIVNTISSITSMT